MPDREGTLPEQRNCFMIIVYPFSLADQQLALKNLQWWNELGGCKGHEVLAVPESRTDQALNELIRVELCKCFDKVYRASAEAQIDGWPEGANYMFRVATGWLAQPGNARKWPY